MTRFVHAADLHVDTLVQRLGWVAPEIAEQLRDSSLRAWDGLVELRLSQGATLLLLAGDIYDGEPRGSWRKSASCAAGIASRSTVYVCSSPTATTTR